MWVCRLQNLIAALMERPNFGDSPDSVLEHHNLVGGVAAIIEIVSVDVEHRYHGLLVDLVDGDEADGV